MMNRQTQWLFEVPPQLETPDYSTLKFNETSAESSALEALWEAAVVVLRSPRFRNDSRLQSATNDRPPLRQGERGRAVQTLQQALIDLKFPMPISTRRRGTPDGIYGAETTATVRKFQQKYGLKVDGVVGRNTMSRLDRLFTSAPPSPPTPPAPPSPPPLPVPPSTPAFRAARECCLLAPTIRPFSPDSNLIAPSSLGTHGSSEANGLIYTGKAGFFDLGHARDLCDLTKYVYDQIAAVRGVPVTVRTAHGTAVVHTAVPSSDWILVARSISYDDSFAYEIMTYDISGVGLHNSAFSPEDLCSNYLGTLLAEKAILAGGTFNGAVTNELATMVRLLDAQPKSETLRAINLINGCWINFTGVTDLFNNAYLKRRNFDWLPWYAGHSSDRPAPSWVTAGFGSAGRFYTYTHTARRTIPKADFAREVTRIRTDAAAKYGPNFNNPRCP